MFVCFKISLFSCQEDIVQGTTFPSIMYVPSALTLPTPGELFACDFQTEQLVGPLCLTLSLSRTKNHVVLILGRTAACVKVHACSSKYLSLCLKLRKHLSALIKREDPPNWHQRDATVN